MSDKDLMAMAQAAIDRYRAMPASERLRHDYLQRRSFARGMCPSNRDFAEHCRGVDASMPDPEGLSDAQIGLILLNSPWHA